MKAFHDKVGFNFVIMLGDNIYGGHSPEDFTRKFETPYKPLLDAGVKFYASLGNHEDPNLERLLTGFLRVMSFLWVIGMAGCVIVIPITAYKLFAVLFEQDEPEER